MDFRPKTLVLQHSALRFRMSVSLDLAWLKLKHLSSGSGKKAHPKSKPSTLPGFGVCFGHLANVQKRLAQAEYKEIIGATSDFTSRSSPCTAGLSEMHTPSSQPDHIPRHSYRRTLHVVSPCSCTVDWQTLKAWAPNSSHQLYLLNCGCKMAVVPCVLGVEGIAQISMTITFAE